MNFKEINVKVIPSNIARKYVMNNHYMKTFPIPKVCFGVIYNDLLVGVLTFGLSTQTGKKIRKIVPRIEDDEFLEMQRMHLMDILGHNAESYVLGRVYRMLKKNTKIKLLVTHSGGCKNECGIVYQSSAWLYFGKTKCEDFYLTTKNEYKNIIAPIRFGRINARSKTKQEVGEELFGAGELVLSNRYLYLYPLNKGLRSFLEKKSLPYPKDSLNFRLNQKFVNGGAE